jgi:glycosyltransferase involved in cell wall biosynthesis
MFPDEFRVDIDYEPKLDNDEWLKQYNIVHYHRSLGPNSKTEELLNRLESLGICSIMDLDDYWSPGIHHPAYHIIKNNKLDKIIVNNLTLARNITTTTSLFADEISKINKNVYVLPNSIDTDEKQHKPNLEVSDKIRIGWLGGSSHEKDLDLLKGVAAKLKSDGLLEKVQFVLCGFDTRGQYTHINKETGEQTHRSIEPEETVWVKYEKIFTDDYKTVSPEYKKYLLKYSNETEYPNLSDEPYRRVWTKSISTYATNYNLFDISLAPIEVNAFNKMKCIVGDSLISTNKGFKYIEDIVKYETVLKTEINGNTNDVINYFKYDNVNTIKITTKDGYNIEGTPHHKIMIGNKWVKLEELAIGGTIELLKPELLQTEYQEITYPMLLTKNVTQAKIDASDENMLPRIRINENWGRLLGYLLGDGNYNAGSDISISCNKRNIDVVEDVVSLYKSIGLNPLVYENSLGKDGNAVDVKSTCVNFLSIAEKYDWYGTKGKTHRIPKVILESPKSVIKEFLKGLIETGGTVTANGIVSFYSKDIKLVEQVQILLLGFDIQSSISYSYNKHHRKYYHNLNLRREGSENYLKHIGFVCKYKQERLNKLKDSTRSNSFIKQEIINIEYKTNSVYDVEVDTVHEYNANGIRNHNSQLKAIEAGFHKKAIIAQDFGPYQLDLTSAIKYGGEIDYTANSILIDTRKNNKDWYSAIKKLVTNPELTKKLQDNLHDTVKNTYSIKTVTEARRKLYYDLLGKLD